MRLLLVVCGWVAAIAVALVIAWKVRRGKEIVLPGKFTAQFVRMIAVVLVTSPILTPLAW